MAYFKSVTMKILFLLLVLMHFSCSENETQVTVPEPNSMYFPDIDSQEWESSSPEELDWNSDAIDPLYDFLQQNNTRAFIVLKEGKIVLENYWGTTIQSTSEFDKNSNWYWASAGKTLTAFLMGIAQENNVLSIEDSSSTYLGSGWTSLEDDQERLIKIKHQLTMTTGLNYLVDDLNCTEPECLTYKTPPGTQWFYHNATYSLLGDIIENASGTSYNLFTDQKIEMKIGMNGSWIQSDYNKIYWSTARDMARFGLLVLNKGVWDREVILNDSTYFSDMVTTSQDLNPSYGYLWWLNGKETLIPPGFTSALAYPLASNAPEDLIAGMGKNGQFLDVIPSQNLIVIRMGEAPDDALVPINFHNDMWNYLNAIIF